MLNFLPDHAGKPEDFVLGAKSMRRNYVPGVRESALPHAVPPPPNRLDGERRRVMVDSNATPGRVVRQVVHALGIRATKLGHDEVVNAYIFRIPFGSQLLANILEITSSSFFFVSQR